MGFFKGFDLDAIKKQAEEGIAAAQKSVQNFNAEETLMKTKTSSSCSASWLP